MKKVRSLSAAYPLTRKKDRATWGPSRSRSFRSGIECGCALLGAAQVASRTRVVRISQSSTSRMIALLKAPVRANPSATVAPWYDAARSSSTPRSA